MDRVPVDLCCQGDHPLHDPFLLNCLHNCCYACLLAVADEEDPKHITCSRCKFVTDLSVLHPNPFLMSEKPSFEEFCFACHKKEYRDVLSEMYCKQCLKVFCRPCAGDHEIHNEGHVPVLQSSLDTDECRIAAAVPCREHKKPLEYLCSDCGKICCIKCVEKQCMTGKHSNKALHDNSVDVQAMMASKRDEINKYTSDIAAFFTSLNRDQWLDEVNAARIACVEALRRNKKEVLDSVEAAFDKAIHDAEVLSDQLSANQASEVKEIHQLKLEAHSAAEYARLVLESGNAFWFLDQGHLIGSCLQRHTHRFSELSAAQAIKDRLVVRNEFRGIVGDTVLKGMIGLPILLSVKAKQQFTDHQDDGREQVALQQQQLSSLWKLKEIIEDEETKLPSDRIIACQIEQCKEKFSSATAFFDHLPKVHFGFNLVHCDVPQCGAHFQNATFLRLHILTCHTELLECPVRIVDTCVGTMQH